MTIQDTSLTAYFELKEKGELGKQEQIVKDYLKWNPNKTNMEVSQDTGIKINAVSGRMNRLVKKNWVIDNGKRICSITGKTVYQWRLI